MLVFISYPRELQELAEILDAELSSRKIRTFLDTEHIPLAGYWRLKIEEAIKEADFFIILYSVEAAEDSNRYFSIELKRIESKCKSNNSTELVTVLFPPAKSESLGPYFWKRQHILATSRDKNASHQWTEKILLGIERFIELKSVAINKQSKKESKLVWPISALLFTLITFLAGSGFVLSNEKNEKTELQNKLSEVQSILDNTTNDLNEAKKNLLKPPLGELVCNSLLGHYELGHEYVFSWDVNSRSIATHDTTWHAVKCIPNDKDNKYSLKGIDKTFFDVETIIEGKYVRIATVPLTYESEVHINNLDGRLIDRVFNAVIPPEEVKKEDIKIYPRGKNKELAKKLSNDFIYSKTDEVLRARYEMHKRIKSSGCSPMQGYRGTRTAIAFVCAHYTRVMVKS